MTKYRKARYQSTQHGTHHPIEIKYIQKIGKVKCCKKNTRKDKTSNASIENTIWFHQKTDYDIKDKTKHLYQNTEKLKYQKHKISNAKYYKKVNYRVQFIEMAKQSDVRLGRSLSTNVSYPHQWKTREHDRFVLETACRDSISGETWRSFNNKNVSEASLCLWGRDHECCLC